MTQIVLCQLLESDYTEKMLSQIETLQTQTHKDSHCTLRDLYFGHDRKEEGGCEHRHWPVSLDQAVGSDQQLHDKATMEMGLPGIF